MKRIFIHLLRKHQPRVLTVEQLKAKRIRDCAAIDVSDSHRVELKSIKRGITQCEIEIVAKSQYEDEILTKPLSEMAIHHTAEPTYRWSFDTVQKHLDKKVNPHLQKPKKVTVVSQMQRALKVA